MAGSDIHGFDKVTLPCFDLVNTETDKETLNISITMSVLVLTRHSGLILHGKRILEMWDVLMISEIKAFHHTPETVLLGQ